MQRTAVWRRCGQCFSAEYRAGRYRVVAQFISDEYRLGRYRDAVQGVGADCRVGRYRDAVQANVNAYNADLFFGQNCMKPYEPEHNTDVLIFAANMAGQVCSHVSVHSPISLSFIFQVFLDICEV